MEKDVLTTSQAAKLLGISVRTAQLLIEGGALTSWKTPGGHRRVYREEVLALIRKTKGAPALLPARVIVVASRQRVPVYDTLSSSLPECTVEIHDSRHSALFALGLRLPAAVIVDMGDDRRAQLSFLDDLRANPALGHMHVVEVGGTESEVSERDASRAHIRVGAPEQLPAALRALLSAAPAITPAAGETPFPVPANESQRLAALERSGLVDTPPEEAFDRLTWLASHTLVAPVALITLLTPTRQWFKSRQGLALRETPRSWAFCNHTLLQRDVMVVQDLARDERFADSPAVAGSPHFRFYAGAPIIDPDGFALGSLCIIDYEPRSLDRDGKRTLRNLADIASDQLRLRAADRRLRGAVQGHDNQQWH